VYSGGVVAPTVLVTLFGDAATFYFSHSLYLFAILSNFDIVLQQKVENEMKGNANFALSPL
jgi:hypothetical protein